MFDKMKFFKDLKSGSTRNYYAFGFGVKLYTPNIFGCCAGSRLYFRTGVCELGAVLLNGTLSIGKLVKEKPPGCWLLCIGY